METTKALAKAIRTLEARGAELLTRLETAESEYASAEKTGASASMLVAYASGIKNAQAEYDSNSDATASLRALHDVLIAS